MTERLLDGSADEILARMANPEDPASGGVAAASACAMAAALVTMTARASVDEWTDAAGVAAQAHLLQGRARALTQTASETFAAARGALRPIGGAGAATALGPALDAAADVPLRVCTTAADIGALAALAAENANADVALTLWSPRDLRSPRRRVPPTSWRSTSRSPTRIPAARTPSRRCSPPATRVPSRLTAG